MPKCSTWVIKLGGALLATAQAATWFEALVHARAPTDRPRRLVVVIGGGRLVGEIRDWQVQRGFSDRQAHELAIRAMALNADAVAQAAPGFARFSGCEPAPDSASAERPALLWRPTVAACDALGAESSWRVTSDSLAALLAKALAAECLVLVKATSRSRSCEIKTLVSGGVVDAAFADVVDPRRIATFIAGSAEAANTVAAFGGHGQPGAAILCDGQRQSLDVE